MIRSDPPGAEVIIDSRRIAQPTPVLVPFTYGGEHDIVLLHPAPPSSGETAYRPALVHYDSDRFLYDGPIVDAFAEFLPLTLHDRQEIDVVLQPSNVRALYAVDPDAYLAALRARADGLRVRSREAQLGARPLDEGTESRPESGPSSRP